MKPTLRNCLLADSDTLSELGNTIETDNGPLTHINNDGSLLAVCHRDYVYWNDKPNIRSHSVRKCPQLDDRLGLYALLNALPAELDRVGCDVRYDILITDSEEVGKSTAQHFNPEDFGIENRYNWIFEFDRAGIDSVMYDYDTPDNREKLESVGYSVGYGSFTDICFLEHLGIAGFNLGTGYHNQHSQKCYADLPQLKKSIGRFAEFIQLFSDTKIEHVENDYDSYGWSNTQERNIIETYCHQRKVSFPTCGQCYSPIEFEDFQCDYCGLLF